MSDERRAEDDSEAKSDVPADTSTGGAPGSGGDDRALPAAPDAPSAGERVDEDGLPLDRPATLDDVRSNAGSGRAIAVGCTVLVALVLLLFWLVRGGLLG